MDAIAQQFKKGLYMATQSFSMLWYQKKLLLYLGLLALINICFKLVLTNLSNGVPFFSLFKMIHHHIASLPLWTTPIETFVLLVFSNVLAMLFTIALLHHVADAMKDAPTSIRSNLKSTVAKFKRILCWAGISSLFETTATMSIDRASELPFIAYLIMITLTILWLISTFFMLPLIAIHDHALLVLVKRSTQLSLGSVAKIIGGECWFGLIILLVSMPFLIIWLLASQPALNPLFPALGLLSAEILVKCWIATAHNIFKMVLLRNQESIKEKFLL